MEHKAERLTRVFVTGTVWVGAGTVVQALMRVAFMAVLTKHFGEALYGLWVVLAATVDILAPLATLGLTYGYARRHAGVSETPEGHRNFIGSLIVVLITGAAVSVTLAALSGRFAHAFMKDSPDGRNVVLAGAALILWTALEFFLRFYFGSRLQMGRRMLLAASRFTLETLATIGGILAGLDLVRIVLLVAIVRLLPSLVAMAGILRRAGLALPTFGGVVKAVRYGFPLQLALTAGLVMRVSDRLVLGHRSPAEAGVYAATYEISAFMLLAVVMLETALFPVLSASFNRGEKRHALAIYRAALKYFLLGSVAGAAVLSVVPRPILALITKPEIADLGGDIAPLVAWGAAFYGVSILARCLVSVTHRTVPAMVATWLCAAAKLGLLIAFVPSRGLMAAGLATVTTFFALMVVMLVMARVAIAAEMKDGSAEGNAPTAAPDPLGSSLGWGVAGMLVAACVAGLPLHLLAGPGVLRLAGSLALFAVVYAAALFALRVVRVEELRTLWRIMVTERPKPGADAESPDPGDAPAPPM